MKRSIVVRVAHRKPLTMKPWSRGADPLPYDEPKVTVSVVRFTKHKARNGSVRISITGDPYAIMALSHHDHMPRHLREAHGLAFTGAAK